MFTFFGRRHILLKIQNINYKTHTHGQITGIAKPS